MVKHAQSSRKRAAAKPPVTPVAIEGAGAEAGTVAADHTKVTQAEAQPAVAAQTVAVAAPAVNDAEARPDAETPSVDQAEARRFHRVDRDNFHHDGKVFTIGGEVLPALTEPQFAQLKAVGAVGGEWDEGEPAT